MILVFGSHGQIGRALIENFSHIHPNWFLHRESRDYCGDLNNFSGITETLIKLRPTVIINAAAYTAVDQAEFHPAQAFAINAESIEKISRIAARINALLVHYSTDYVFSGSGTRPWSEADMAKPISVYGESKLYGEKAIQHSGVRHFIIRASWVYSHRGNNFLKLILRLADSEENIKIVNDQWGVPTHANLLARTTRDLIRHAISCDRSAPGNSPPFGIYHCTPSGETNWFEYAQLVINTAKAAGAARTCKRLIPISNSEYPTAAKRPLNSRLNTKKLQSLLGVQMPDWRHDVISTVHRVLEEGYIEPASQNEGRRV